MRLMMLVVPVLLGGCTSLASVDWPWRDDPVATPAPVHELAIDAVPAAPIRQYRDGNTLVVDLTKVPAHGRASLRAVLERGWPVRIAVRVLPGRFATLEVRGAQRLVLPIASEGASPVELTLPPSLHAVGTPAIELAW